MNELLNYLNNYTKNRKNKQRFSAIMVCLAVIVSFTVSVGLIEPAESASGELICGMEEHEHTQDCFELICGFDEETEEEIVVETTVSDNEETMESTTSTEETTTAATEPATTETATTDTETTETIISTCTDESVPAPVHIHNDECYRLICLTEAHLHKQDCYNQPAETEPAATETSTSTSTETDTTATTEQTTETTTTTTELPEEIYELNAALFGELYMDRVNILADETEETGYKFYYTGGEANQLYAHNYFTYHNTANGEPTKNIVRTYNGNTYNYAYNFNGANSERFVSLNAQFSGTLILLWGEGDDFKVKVLNEATNQPIEKEFKTGDDGIMVVPVVQGVNYKVTQSGGSTKARLVYAEFVPTFTKEEIAANLDKTYRIRNVKTGLYVEVEDAGTKNNTKIKIGQYSYDDKRNDFKFADAGDENFFIYPQLDYSNSAIQMLDCDDDGNLQTYSTTNWNQPSRKYRFNSNSDGTFKINTYKRKDEDTVVNLYIDNNSYIKGSTETSVDDFIIVEATEMVKPEVVYPPANIDGKTYLIKNVRSRQYIHMEAEVYRDSDGNIIYKKNYTDEEWNAINNKTYSTEQIIQMKDVGADSQFKFISTGTAGEYYIVSADGNYALTTNWNVQNGADVRYESFDNNINSKDQIFHAEQMENGSIRFYQIDNNGKKFYLEINGQSTNTGADVDLLDANKVNDHQCFFLVPVVAPEEVPEANTRVEARVIFADYNDGKIDENTRNLYDEPAWIPTFSLYKNGNLEENKDGNLVVDVSSARKDWCYQYNYVWNLGKSNTTDKYYVALNGVNNKQITLNGKTFRVHYLKDTELGHPGQCNKNDPYSQSPSDYNQTGDQIIYIFLDPVVEEWWPNGNQPGTFDLSMKKRWDGHNASGYDNRPKEKIKIQLQRLNSSGQWLEYKPEDFGETYTFKCYFEVVDVNGKNKRYVDLREFLNYKKNLNIPDATNVTNIKRTLTNNGAEYTIVYNNETYTFSEDDFNYEDLKNHNCLFEKESETHKRANLELGYNEWNNVVLTVDGNNNPTHFTNGYYFNWKAIPYGQYRVIETQSFYDANDNNVLDAGDRDTSQEYYYMSYPPMRDSRGVLHIQNFTKDMVLDIQKKWYDDTGTVEAVNPGKTVKVNIYRSLVQTNDPTADALDYVCTKEVTGDNIILKTTENCPELLLKNQNDQKYYYYIQEVKVDGYLLKNGNDDGFVKNVNGNFYVDYEDGDGRKFIIENKAKIGIKLNKEWYDTENDANNTNKMTFAEGNEPNAEFEIYKSSYMGDPTKTGEDYLVNNTKLEKIADAKIDKNGQFEIYSGEESKGNGTSKVMSNQLHIYGTEEVFNGVTTTNSGGVFEDGGLTNNENKYYTFGKNRLYVAPPSNYGGVLELTFTEISDTDEVLWRNQDTSKDELDIVLSSHKDYKQGKDLTISISLNPSDDKSLRKKENTNPKLKSAVFYPYNYYYIREKNSDNCKLIGGDGNGFVVLQDTNTYYLNLSTNSDATRYPIITAKNVPKVNFDITKEWTQSNANISKAMNFEIYKAFANGEPVADDKGYKVTVNDADYQLTKLSGEYKTDENGNLNVADLAAFEKDSDGKYHKLYYYVREVDGNYTITNTNAKNGFIPYESEKYGTAYDDTSSNSGKYKFTNTPKLDLTVNKIWKNANGESYNAMVSTEIKFKVYRKIENGEFMPVPENGTDYVTSGLKKVIEGLDAYDSSGNKYTYYIKEIDGETYFLSGFNVKYNDKTTPEECAFSWNKDGEKPVINITNQAKPQNYELPETGGSGTHGCTAAGGTIVLLSAVVLLLKRRKKMV